MSKGTSGGGRATRDIFPSGSKNPSTAHPSCPSNRWIGNESCGSVSIYLFREGPPFTSTPRTHPSSSSITTPPSPPGLMTDHIRHISAISSHPSTPPLPDRPHFPEGLVCFVQKSLTISNGRLLCTGRVVTPLLENLRASRTYWNI
jgi:hypothetical protein